MGRFQLLTTATSTGGGGGNKVTTITTTRTAGNVVYSSTSYADVDNALDIPMPAIVGDVLEVSVSGQGTGVSGSDGRLDCFFINGTNRLSGSSSSIASVPNWYLPPLSNSLAIGGSRKYTVVLADISSGTVVCRLKLCGTGSLAATLIANTATPLQFSVSNFGH